MFENETGLPGEEAAALLEGAPEVPSFVAEVPLEFIALVAAAHVAGFFLAWIWPQGSAPPAEFRMLAARFAARAAAAISVVLLRPAIPSLVLGLLVGLVVVVDVGCLSTTAAAAFRSHRRPRARAAMRVAVGPRFPAGG